MKTLLYVTTSVRDYNENDTQHQSITRSLGECFISRFLQHGQAEVIYRDLALEPPNFITKDFIAAAFEKGTHSIKQKELLQESDKYIQEIELADIIVIASPMYNYGMPATLKAWFDQVIRVNKTFTFDLLRGDEPLEPILNGKSLVLLASWGEFNFKNGEPKSHLNHLSSHVEQLSPYLGADHCYHIASEFQEFADERHQVSKEIAFKQTRELATKLATK